MAAPVRTEIRDGVFRIILDRPEVRNAFDDTTIEALRQAAERAAAEKEIIAVLLEGSGPVFCAGADIRWMEKMGAAPEEENLRSAERLARLFLELDRIPKPVVGRIQGAAMGGGLGLTAICDAAVAARDAVFSLSEGRLGLTPSVIAPYVVRKLGAARTLELVVTGRRIRGGEACSLGLISQVVDAPLLDAAVEGVLAAIRLNGPQANLRAKALIREIARMSRTDEELVRWTAEETASARAGDEARAGLAAFLEKRRAPWAIGHVAPASPPAAPAGGRDAPAAAAPAAPPGEVPGAFPLVPSGEKAR
jgi:methylglutaconyl-CoA hydratase